MRVGIFAKTFPGSDPAAVLAEARAAGFDAVQYNMACSGVPSLPDAITPLQADAVRHAATQAGLAIAAVSGTYNMIHPDPSVRATGLAHLEVLAAAAAGMGTSLVTLCTGTRDPHDQWRGHPDNGTPEAWRDLLVEMGKAVAIAERHGVRLGIEPELSNVVNSAARARQLLDAVDSPVLAIVLDAANLFERESLADQRKIISRAVDLLADRIVMVHAKDRMADGAFTTPGNGVLDYPHYLGRLKASGFAGDLVTHGLAAAEAPAVASFLRRALR